MVAVQNYHGNPAPPGKPVLTFQIGDVIELLRGDPDSPWWEVRGIPLGKLLETFQPATPAFSLLFVAFPGAGEVLGGSLGSVPTPAQCHQCPQFTPQSDAQLGFAGEAPADEEVGIFPQLLGETLPRGCQGKCQGGDGAGSARWLQVVGLSLSLFSAFSWRSQSFPGTSVRLLPPGGGGSLIPWLQVSGQGAPSPVPKAGLASSDPALFPLCRADSGAECSGSAPVQENCVWFILIAFSRLL